MKNGPETKSTRTRPAGAAGASGSARPTVVVTGSTGRIGSRLCPVLQRDFRVVGIDRDEPREGEPSHWIHCDLTDDASVQSAFREVLHDFGPDLASVVHLAAYYDFSGEPSSLYDDLTVEGTRRLVRELRAFRAAQLVFSSSLLVHAPPSGDGVLDEDSALRAEWAYPASKLRAERVLREEAQDLPTVVLRIGGVYDDWCHSIPLAHQIRRIRERRLESHVFPGNPRHGQSFVHVDDVVECIRRVVGRRGDLASQETFLVGEPDVVGYGEIQDLVGRELHGTTWATIRIPAAVAKAGAWIQEKTPLGGDPFIKPWMIDRADDHLPVSIEHARAQLGWDPRHRLRQELPVMARRLLGNPAAWYRENGLEPPEELTRHRTGAGHGR